MSTFWGAERKIYFTVFILKNKYMDFSNDITLTLYSELRGDFSLPRTPINHLPK